MMVAFATSDHVTGEQYALGLAAFFTVSLGGLFIGIIQAATSINEMTLSFIPKLIAMALALLLFGSWMLVTLVDFTRSIFERIPTLFI